MTESISRRGLIVGLTAFIAAPAIIRVVKLMPIRVQEPYRIISQMGIIPLFSEEELRRMGWTYRNGELFKMVASIL